MSLEGFTISNHVYIPEKVFPDSLFEQKYTSLRSKEHRMYSDEELSHLPRISEEHPHYKEWIMRRQSSARLTDYLKRKETPLKILEIGCGNGWLSRQLAGVPDSKVIGCDINFTELQQAARVFKDVPGLHFIYGDLENDLFNEEQFDIIVFAACIQYFQSLRDIVLHTNLLLKQKGEIHILDSPFYKPTETDAARNRTLIYYHELGYPEMAKSYFHHTFDELSGFPYEVLYRPTLVGRYLLGNANPFPWICIRKIQVDS